MDGPTLEKLPPFSTIGYRERVNILQSIKRPLSGYLGGATPRGGYWTDKLEEQWSNAFECKYSVPCNSATSGLLAACMAARIGPGDEVWTTAYSMSATASCAIVLGAGVKFLDIEPIRFSINLNMLIGTPPKAIIVTNLFGHPAYLHALRLWCDQRKVVMIEDNAQSIFAMENGKYAGTIGHMGVFSLNVHKHLNCGEGGMVCTNDSEFSTRLRHAINHGELSGSVPQHIGLNLRMTEPIAAIACAQLSRATEIMNSRRELAEAITKMMAVAPWIRAPIEDIECKHSYYVWAGLSNDPVMRTKFVHELNLRGFTLREGYIRPLHHVFRSADLCPETERIELGIVTFEICAYDPKAHHLKKMRDIVEYVAEAMSRNDSFIKGEKPWKSLVVK